MIARFFRRADGRVCILSPAPLLADIDPLPKNPHRIPRSMLCGGATYQNNEVDGPATCLGCMAEYKSGDVEEENYDVPTDGDYL